MHRDHPALPATAPVDVPQNRLNAVDGLRVLAALAVLVFHVAGITGLHYGDGPLAWVMSRGEARVAIFFAVSGLLLYRPWAKSLLGSGPPPGVRVYLLRRVLRIFPLYWLVALVALAAFNLDRAKSPWDWIEVLLLLHVYDPTPWWPVIQLAPVGLQQMWTLAIDVSFYLVLPLLAAAIAFVAKAGGASVDTRAKRALLALGLLSLGSFGYLYLIRYPVYTMRMEWWLPRFFPWFAVGMAVCVLTMWSRANTEGGERVRRWCEEIAANAGTCFLFAALLFGLVATPLGGPKTPQSLVPDITADMFRLTAYTLMTLFVVMPVAVRPAVPTWVHRALGHPAMSRLANLSYGLFVWQIIVIWVYYDITGRPHLDQQFVPVFTAVLAASTLLAWIGYLVIEKPARVLGQRLETRRTAPPPQS
ncbi:acyltransferase [Microtetraspora sp. NBRC 16547]|uniref:acyltransferase family protein n=1 Tax=Microtetraspora sp. NBRC 16547 TaxID=3030993 RepID=UPI00255338C6|nr:acyltransferase [Microtetraspora sp. NBRC 16547]